MSRCLSSLMLVLLLGGLGQTAEQTPSIEIRRSSCDIGRQICVVANRLQGRVLGSFVSNGMGVEQVECILGKDPSPLPRIGLHACGLFRSMSYHDLGVWVSLCSDQNNILRVYSVSFRPLFD